MEWKPIKTAPKNGTQILLCSVDDDGSYGIRQCPTSTDGSLAYRRVALTAGRWKKSSL